MQRLGGIFIPYSTINNDILRDKNISAEGKIIWIELYNLSKRENYSWATDEYLSKICNISKSTVQRHLKQLEKYGYIKRVTLNKGFIKQRNIEIPDEYKI
mgnify:CR=1 FL=1